MVFSGVLAREAPTQDSAQTIQQEILAHSETDLSLLGKSRAVLLEAIQAADTAKAHSVLAYMASRFDPSKIIALYQHEELWIAFWVRDYEKVFRFTTRAAPDERLAPRLLRPIDDLFFPELVDASRGAATRLRGGVKDADLPPHKKDFLLLMFDYLISLSAPTREEVESHQQKLNADADEYLALYRDSEFNAFIRGQIRYVVLTSDWGYGLEAGLGYLALPDKLSRSMKDFGLLSFAVEATYKNAYAGFRLDVGAAHNMRKGFDYNGTWKDGLLLMHWGGMLAVGPRITPGNGFMFTPHAGIGFINFAPPEDEKKIAGNDVSLTVGAIGVGSNFDIPLGGEETSIFLRVYAGHRWAVTNIDLAKGGYTYITLGVDFFERKQYVE
jgi:hypothetical protein